MEFLNPLIGGNPRGAARQTQDGTLVAPSHDLYVPEGHVCAPARSEKFHDRLLGGKPRRQALRRPGSLPHPIQFVVRENSSTKSFSIPLQARPKAFQTHQVGSHTLDLTHLHSYTGTMSTESLVLDGLNPQQREAVDHFKGPLCVLAGAGSGKTRVITRRIARLIERGVPEETILAVTFTNKAAREMRERVRRLVGACRSTVCTFHAFGARLLREEGHRLDRPRDFSLLDRADGKSAVKICLERLQLDASAHPPGAVVEDIGGFKSSLLTPDDAEEASVSRREEERARIFAEYERLLREWGAFDFDDLLSKSVQLLESEPALARAVGECYQFVLVDEYQDVNLAQYRLTRLIGRTHSNLCVTGDPDQCIYAWRGADIRYILDFPNEYPTAKVVVLDQNYRSRNTILRAASSVIRHNALHGDKHLWSERGEGPRIRIQLVQDEIEEARAVIDRIAELRAQGARRQDIAVFYRLNSLSLPVERALIQNGIPYQVWRGVEFFGRKEVKDALAWLRYLQNPRDFVSLKRIINVPSRGIGPKALEAIATLAAERGTSAGMLFWDEKAFVGFKAKRRREALEAFGGIVRELIGAKDELSPSRFIHRVLETSGYFEQAAKDAGLSGVDPRGNLEQLINFAAEFEARHDDATLAAFLEEVSLLTDADAAGDGEDRVALLTVHVSKGLEFPHVIVLGLEQDLFPHRRPDQPADEEEERRLFYVALTRAKEDVLLVTARERTRFGRTNFNRPSIFLMEIPEELTELRDTTGGAREGFEEVQVEYEPDADPALASLRAGTRVRHEHFGYGTVKKLSGSSRRARIVVDFDEAGQRRLSLAHTRLDVVEDGY